MYVILDFIWTRVKKDFKKRLLIIDEAWYFMQHPDSAKFIYSMTKRARKYYLGITTITQDVEDFLHNDFGKAIVSNASIKFLMKQSTASIPALSEAFYLSEGERQLLVSADIGEGVFFAGQNHVALRVVASDEEHQVITTDPREIDARRKQQQASARQTSQSQTQNSHQESQQRAPTSNQNNQETKASLPNKEFLGQLMSSLASKKSNQKDSSEPQQNQSKRAGHYTIDDYSEPT